jgi:hypothetical protein
LKVFISDAQVAEAEITSQISDFSEIHDNVLAQKTTPELISSNGSFSLLCEIDPLKSSFISSDRETDPCEPDGFIEELT